MVLGYENSLTIIRGDTDSLTITCTNKDGSIHPLTTGDTIYFSLKKTIEDTTVTLQKVVDTFTAEGKAVIVLSREDTLSLTRSQYRYGVQLKRSDGTVSTLAYGIFNVKEVVSYE